MSKQEAQEHLEYLYDTILELIEQLTVLDNTTITLGIPYEDAFKQYQLQRNTLIAGLKKLFKQAKEHKAKYHL